MESRLFVAEEAYKRLDAFLAEQTEEFTRSRLKKLIEDGQVCVNGETVKKAGEVDRAIYRIQVDCQPSDIERLLAMPSIRVEKKTKKKTMKTIDLRPVLDNADNRIETQENGAVWELTLPCNSTDSVNPSLLVAALKTALNREEIAAFVQRLAVLDQDGAVFA